MNSAPHLIRPSVQQVLLPMVLASGLGIGLASVSTSIAGLMTGLVVGIVCVAGGFLWAQAQMRTLSKSLETLTTIAQAVAETYLPDISISDRGDIGAFATNLIKQMAGQLEEQQLHLANITSVDRQLQAELQKIFATMQELESDNLTVQSGAEGVDRSIKHLARVIKNFGLKSQEVSDDRASLQSLVIDLSDRVQQQQALMQQTQTAMEGIANLVTTVQHQEVAANQASQLTEKALKEAQQGIISLTDSINSLQQGAGLIVQRIRNLDEFVTLAKQFVLDQKRLASLTQVLAMNASMVAARASEQREPDQFASVAREFAVIASQVNNLATQTNQGLVVLQQRTGFVEVVVSGIDRDVQGVNNMVSQLNGSIDQSQQSFDYLKQLSRQVAEVKHQVMLANQSLETSIQKAFNATHALSETNQTIVAQTAHANHQGQLLHANIQQLQQMIARFRLPQ